MAAAAAPTALGPTLPSLGEMQDLDNVKLAVQALFAGQLNVFNGSQARGERELLQHAGDGKLQLQFRYFHKPGSHGKLKLVCGRIAVDRDSLFKISTDTRLRPIANRPVIC